MRNRQLDVLISAPDGLNRFSRPQETPQLQ
jgi:hypothetical protein